MRDYRSNAPEKLDSKEEPCPNYCCESKIKEFDDSEGSLKRIWTEPSKELTTLIITAPEAALPTGQA